MFNSAFGLLMACTLLLDTMVAESPFASDNMRYTEERTQKPVILDMDFSSDVDDVCALRVAANADAIGEISLKAVTLSVKEQNDLNIKAVDGILKYQGFKNILYGTLSQPVYDESPYWNVLAGYSDGDYVTDTAVNVWRKVISESDRRVDIITTGYLMNFVDFCKSEPDEVSELSGMEMLNERVGNVYIVGGSWTDGYDNNFFFYEEARRSVQWILDNVNRPLFFIDNKVGGPVLCGAKLEHEYPDDPVSKALMAFGTDYGRAAWDPFSMYICAYVDNKEQLEELGLGIMPINFGFDITTGENHWSEAESSNFYRIHRINEDLQYYADMLDNYCIVER